MKGKYWILIAGFLIIAILVGGAIYHFTGTEGTLVVQLSDPKADVKIEVDGKPMMPGDDGTYRLPIGDYEVSVKGDEYESESKLVRIKARERKVVAFELQKKKIDPLVLQKREAEKLAARLAKAKELAKSAKSLIAEGKHQQALALVNQAIGLDPDPAPLQILRGQLLAARGDDNEALAAFTKAIELDAKLADAFVGRAQLHASHRSWKDVTFDASRALGLEPTNSMALHLRSLARFHLDNFPAGIADAETALKSGELTPLLHYNLGLARGAIGEYALALKHFSRVLELDKENPLAFLARSEILARQGKMDGAMKDRSHALKLLPTIAKWQEPLMSMPPSKKWIGSSRAHKEKAIDLAKKAGENIKRGMLDATLDLADQALKLDPHCADAYAWRAAVAAQRDDPKQALADCNEAIQLDPGCWRAYLTRASVWDEHREPDKIIVDATVVLMSRPKEARALVLRANGFSHKREFERAIANGIEALKIDPKNATAHHQLGYACAMLGEFESAVEHFGRAIALNPQEAKSYWWRAAVHLKRGDKNKANADIKAVAKIDDELAMEDPPVLPDPPKIEPHPKGFYHHRAKDQEKKGHLEAAIVYQSLAMLGEKELTDGRLYRASLFMQRGNLKEAEIDLLAIQPTAENREQILAPRVEACLRMGSLPMALTSLNLLCEINPKSATYFQKRAAVHRAIGNLIPAVEDQEKAIQLDSKLKDAPAYVVPDPPLGLVWPYQARADFLLRFK